MLLDHPDFPLIDLAGKAAAQAYQLILAGKPVPFMLYHSDPFGQLRSTQPGGALAGIRAQLHAAGAASQLLLFEMNARFEDCPAERALFIEFGASCGLLHGLVLALPYITNRQRQCIPGMIQLQRCPAPLRHLADDLLPRFTRALRKSAEGSAWQQAREYDRLAAPSLEAFEATRRAVDALCPALRPDDPAGDSNVLANRHVDALVERYPFEHGIAYRKALYQLGLDLSASSLLRIDNLLEQLKPRLAISEAQFLAHPANRNFLHVLAFYIGTVLAQESGARIDWYTAGQLQRAHAIAADAQADPRKALAALLNKRELYFPLQLLLERLFGACSSADFRAELMELGRMAAGSRAPRLLDDMEHVQRRIDLARSTDPDYLVPERPSWVDGDSFELWFQNVGALFLGGRLVWGQVTQANSLMWREGSANCPGEVLYDLRGISGSEELGPIATTIFDYKGTRPLDHRLAFLSDHLMHERTSTFGLPLPLRLSGADLRLASIFFDRKHLPGGYLQSGLVPLLIHDDYPGIVTVLPERFWTVEVQAHARRNGWPV